MGFIKGFRTVLKPLRKVRISGFYNFKPGITRNVKNVQTLGYSPREEPLLVFNLNYSHRFTPF